MIRSSVGMAGEPAMSEPSVEGSVLIAIWIGATELVMLSLQLSMTIAEVKEIIQEREGIPVNRQRLIFNIHPNLLNDRTLGECGIQNNSVMHLVVG